MNTYTTTTIILIIDIEVTSYVYDPNRFTLLVEGMVLSKLYTKGGYSASDYLPFYKNSPLTSQRESAVNDIYRYYEKLTAKYADPDLYRYSCELSKTT